MTRFAGLATIDRLGLKNVVPSSVALPDQVRDYRFAVIRGESQLLARLNEGLARIQRTASSMPSIKSGSAISSHGVSPAKR